MKTISFSSASVGEGFSGVARIMSKRHMGKILFVDCRFVEEVVQFMFSWDKVTNFKDICTIPVGSLIKVKGEKILTQTNTPALFVSCCELIHACKTNLHGKFHGMRYRNRPLDLVMNKESFDNFRKFSEAAMTIRMFLYDHSYSEFLTGVMQETFEAGQAKPFKTFCNATNKDLYLSLTSELKLKRLLVGGFDKVFEITQSFRNEGVDYRHSPEFTILEMYAKDHSCSDMMSILEAMISLVMSKIATGSNISFEMPFERVSFLDAFEKYVGNYSECTLESLSRNYPALFYEGMTSYAWIKKVIKKLIVTQIKNPTFLTNLPVGMSPLAKVLPCGEFTDRSFLIVNNMSIADIYTDENDPIILGCNLEKQSLEIGRVVNAEFLATITSLGLGPSAGIGLSINRLNMLLISSQDKDIKDTILYPLLGRRKGARIA